MSDELDLEHGDPERAEEVAEKTERKFGRASVKKGNTSPRRPSGTKRPTAADRVENGLFERCVAVFDRIANTLEARNDDELANAIREDKGAMSTGLVSLTRNVKPLRSPLIIILNLVEPALAFGRVGRILIMRVQIRRAQRIAEWEAQQQEFPQEYAGAPVVDGVPVV